MKLSLVEIVVQCVVVLLVAPAAAALLTPSVDALSVAFAWLGIVALFEVGFFTVRWLRRRK
jgi:Sec-independent protein secretion pathway component TatC